MFKGRRLAGNGDVTIADRQLAKAVNFGLFYGMGVDGFRAYARTNYGVELTEVGRRSTGEPSSSLTTGCFASTDGSGMLTPTKPEPLADAAACSTPRRRTRCGSTPRSGDRG
jgi:hypothetical protein